MNNSYHTLPLDELLRMYQISARWQKNLNAQEHSALCYALGETNVDAVLHKVTEEKETLWAAMQTKIPTSHIAEIETIKAELNMPSHDSPKIDIQPGQRWQHKYNKSIIIEIAGREPQEAFWQVGEFIQNKYIMTCRLTTMTIIKYFNRLPI